MMPSLPRLTGSVSSVLLDSGPLAVEGVVGRALKAFGANARGPAAGGLVAESGERGRGARGGTEAQHFGVMGVVRREWRVEGWFAAGSSLGSFRSDVGCGRFRVVAKLDARGCKSREFAFPLF